MAEQAQVEHSEEAKVELSVEERVANLFEPKTENKETQTEAKTETQEEVPADSQEQTEEAKTEETDENALPEAVDVELDGKQYKVAPPIKDAMMRQADYTKKTQEVAEIRKAAEAAMQQASQVLELQKGMAKELGQLESLNEQIAQYEKVDWNTLTAQDATKAQQLFISFQQAKDSRQKMIESLGQKQSQQMEAVSKARQARLEEGQKALSRDIKGWNADLGAKILKSTQEAYGAPVEQLAGITEPWAVRALHDAMRYRELQASKPALEKRAPAQEKTLKPKASDQRSSAETERQQFRSQMRAAKSESESAKIIESRLASKFR